mmetsp:Transcript_23358/g.51834  ORF Transcript_23358/g.51834 Transcript_23358/m.51834 type:complete len:260 (-) Transcript_23358:3-782(-)
MGRELAGGPRSGRQRRRVASLQRPELLVELRVRERGPIVLLEALARTVALALPANLWQDAVHGAVRHAQGCSFPADGVLGEPVLQGLAVHLLLLPGHGVDGRLRPLEAPQHRLILGGDLVQRPALVAAVQALRDDLALLALLGDLRRLGVDVQHLLQQDAILELDLGGPIFLQRPRLHLVGQVRILRWSPRVDHALRLLDGAEVLLVLVPLHAVSHHAVARDHVPGIASVYRHGQRCAGAPEAESQGAQGGRLAGPKAA